MNILTLIVNNPKQQEQTSKQKVQYDRHKQ